MLKLSRKISLDGKTKKIIKLPSSSTYFPEKNTIAYVQGWGVNPSDTETKQMYRTAVNTLSREDCAKHETDPFKNHNNQICTLGDNNSGTCPVRL